MPVGAPPRGPSQVSVLHVAWVHEPTSTGAVVRRALEVVWASDRLGTRRCRDGHGARTTSVPRLSRGPDNRTRPGRLGRRRRRGPDRIGPWGWARWPAAGVSHRKGEGGGDPHSWAESVTGPTDPEARTSRIEMRGQGPISQSQALACSTVTLTAGPRRTQTVTGPGRALRHRCEGLARQAPRVCPGPAVWASAVRVVQACIASSSILS